MSDFRRYYYENNTVFITLVTYNRKPILVQNIDKIRTSLKSVKYEYKIVAGIVLHDHMHLLIQVKNPDEVSKIIATFKSDFSRNFPYNQEQTSKQKQRREKGVWQRKYYDHIIRNQEDLYRHIDYIHYNSVKHYNINPIEWEYSSFQKFVKKNFYEKDWCNAGDKYNISCMDLE